MNDSAPSKEVATAEPVPEREVTLREVLEMAQNLQRSERFAEAEALYLQLLNQLPDEPNVLNFFGVLRHHQGRHDEALALLERAILQAPGETGPWINLANVLIERGYHDDAIKALNNVIALDPDAVMPHNNLGILHTRRGEWEAAESALLRALELGPSLSYVHCNLAGMYFRSGRMKESAAHALQAMARDRSDPKARKLLTRALFLLGQRDEAIQNLRDWLAEQPGNPEAQHYLAAAGDAEVPGRASDQYVQQVFDRFADSFELQLEKLGYQAPRFVGDELARLRSSLPEHPRVLDAGCGTGLCGPLLRPLAARLEGVDLSAGMLRRAEARGDYDELQQAELTAFLQAHPGRWDAIASADVMIYFGDLEPLLRAAADALRPGGVLVATLEALAEGDDRDYALEVHGRYAHHRDYLAMLLSRHGLQLDRIEGRVLRSELTEPVQGWVFSARKPTAEA